MTAAPPSDRAVRERAASDFTCNWIVTAGAGTGKTTLLVDRLLCAIEQEGMAMDELVAITFTEAAAAELRDRVQSAIEVRAGSHDGDDRWERALRDIDRADLTTIHAFAGSLLRAHPIEAGIDPGARIADPVESRVLLASAWRTFIGTELRGEATPAWRRVLERGGLAALRELAFRMALERDVLVPPPARLGDPDAVGAELMTRLRALLDEAEGLLGRCERPEDTVPAKIAEIEALLDRADGASSLAALLQEEDPPRKTSARSHRHWRSREDFLRAKELANEACRVLALVKELPEEIEAHEATRCALDEIRSFLELYEEEKRRAGVLDFQDLLLRARDLLLHHRELRQRTARRIGQLLVDEFQDTDPLQAEIVLLLCDHGARAGDAFEVAPAPGKLFLVGDPKQSIYGWRRADMGVYERVRRLVLEHGGEEAVLEANFRSSGPVLRLVNDLFEKHMKPLDQGFLQPAYRPIVRARAQPDVDQPQVHLLGVTPASLGVEKLSTARAGRAEAAAVVRCLVRHVSGAAEGGGAEEKAEPLLVASPSGPRPVRWGDVAVLARGHRQLRPYELAFQEAGLPYIVVGGKGYFHRPEVADLVHLLRALADAEDRLSLVGALRSPLFALPDEDLAALGAAGRLDWRCEPPRELAEPTRRRVNQAWDDLHRWHRLARRLPVAELLDRILEESPLAPAAATEPDGLQRVANLHKLRDLAARYAPAEAPTLDGFLGVLDALGDELPEEGESPLSEEGIDSIRMMTIHKAKGLEFPLVVLAGLHSAGPGGARSEVVLRRSDEGTDLGISVGPWRTLSWKTELATWEKRRRDAEALRLLYVALTRARDHLLLAGGFANRRRGGNWIDLLCEHLGLEEGDFEASAPPGQDDLGLTRGELDLRLHAVGSEDVSLGRRPLEEVLAASPPDPDPLAVSREAAVGREAEPADLPDPPEPQGSPVEKAPSRRERSVMVGSAVHHVLEGIEPERVEGWQGRLDRWLSARPLPEGLREEIRGRAGALVGALLASDFWADLSEAEAVWREVPLALLDEDDRCVEARADLVLETRTGELELVDWKTDDLGGRDPTEAARDHEDQARLYVEAVKRATGRKVSRFVVFYLDGCHAVTLHP